jgi:hypothetical protein
MREAPYPSHTIVLHAPDANLLRINNGAGLAVDMGRGLSPELLEAVEYNVGDIELVVIVK